MASSSRHFAILMCFAASFVSGGLIISNKPHIFHTSSSIATGAFGLNYHESIVAIRSGCLFWRRSYVHEGLSQPSVVSASTLRRAIGFPGSSHLGVIDHVSVISHRRLNCSIVETGLIIDRTNLSGQLGGGWAGYDSMLLISVDGSALVVCGFVIGCGGLILRFHARRRSRTDRGFPIEKYESNRDVGRS
jgi:hypothetical protein